MAILMRYLMLAALSLALLLGRALPAAGHAAPVTMDPPGGASVGAVPEAVRLKFSQPVELRFSRVEVRSGKQLVGDGAALRLDGSRTLVHPLPPLAPGRYDVAWRVLSTDGHVTEGSYWFKVAEGATGTILAPSSGGSGAGPGESNWAIYGPVLLILSALGLMLLSLARRRREASW